MKCKSCDNKTNEILYSMVGIRKNISVHMCYACGTVYIGGTLDSNFSGNVPENAIVDYERRLVFIPTQSAVTIQYLKNRRK